MCPDSGHGAHAVQECGYTYTKLWVNVLVHALLSPPNPDTSDSKCVDSGLFSPCAWLTLQLTGEHLLPVSCLAGLLHCQCKFVTPSSGPHSPSATNAFLIDHRTFSLVCLCSLLCRGEEGMGWEEQEIPACSAGLSCARRTESFLTTLIQTAVMRRVEGWHTKLIVGNLTRKPTFTKM